ncbi:LOW QUALITY PROTEIN: hypothetical protein V2J09_010391 [Rumex salicifolius]
MQEKTTSIIRLCLVDEVIDLKTSKQIWDRLENMYMLKSLSCKLFLKQRLHRLNMSDSLDLVQHIISDLGRVGVKVDEEDQAMIFLCSLNPAYGTLLTALTCGKGTISLETISSALLSHNERRQHIDGDKSQADELYTSNIRKGEDRRTSKQMARISGYLSQRPRGKAVYFGCAKIGHFKRDCTNRKQNSEKIVLKVGIQIFSPLHRCTDSWILDSGCSFQMTPYREWFETYKAGNLGAMTVMKGQITVGRVYRFIESTVVGGATATVSESDNTTLWHLHMGTSESIA